MDEPSSQHAQLEVAILGAELSPPETEASESRSDSPGGRLILILSADPEVRAYVRKCLQALKAVDIGEAVAWNEVPEPFLGSTPHLMVVEASDLVLARRIGGFIESCLQHVPRLLLLDDRVPDGEPDLPDPCVVILKPFNAERIVGAASMLLD